MKNFIKEYFLVIIFLVILLVFTIYYFYQGDELDKITIKETKGVALVTTMNDNLSSDSVWCPTFQLIWNDLKNNIIKEDIVFPVQPESVTNLNKGEFTINDINEKYIYTKYGFKTLEIKEEIERAIKEKFNETSEILNDFDWSNEALNSNELNRYFLYAMLKHEFKFEYPFDILENYKFKDIENINSFGIDKSSSSNLRSQITVLFYEDYNNFAIKVNTKDNDEIILYKENSGTTFNEIYKNLIEKSNNYKDKTKFTKSDKLMIPNIKLNIKEHIKDVEKKPFYVNGQEMMIYDAIELIKFELDNSGGKIKSEAGMDMGVTSIDTSRNFILDNTFTLFIKEKAKNIPYFALRVDDISKFQ